MPSPDGVIRLSIVKDTISFTTCLDTSLSFCKEKEKETNEILMIKNKNGFHFLYTRNLDKRFNDKNNFQLIILQYLKNDDVLLVVKEKNYFASMEELKKNITFDPESKFVCTYYSGSMIHSFATYLNVSEIDSSMAVKFKEDIKREWLKNEEKIKRTNTNDLYGTLITRELVNRILIARKINPFFDPEVFHDLPEKFPFLLNK